MKIGKARGNSPTVSVLANRVTCSTFQRLRYQTEAELAAEKVLAASVCPASPGSPISEMDVNEGDFRKMISAKLRAEARIRRKNEGKKPERNEGEHQPEKGRNHEEEREFRRSVLEQLKPPAPPASSQLEEPTPAHPSTLPG